MIGYLELVVTVFASIMASSGFWMYIVKKSEKKSCETRLIKGLAHDRIVYLASKYLDRGWVTDEEYDNLYTYLYQPYHESGGNGLCSRLVEAVGKLPIKPVASVINELKEGSELSEEQMKVVGRV